MDLLKYAEELSENYKHPTTFWMGPFFIAFIADPDDLQIILNHPNALSKTFIYSFGHDYIGNSLLLIEGTEWKNRRKMIKPTFNVEVLEGYISKFDKISEVLVEQLRRTNGQEVDVFSYVVKCTIDMISETAFDTTINAQTNKIGDEMTEAMHNIFSTLLRRAIQLWLYLDAIFHRSSLYKSFMKSISVFHSYTDKVFNRKMREWQNRVSDEHFSTKIGPKCFVDSLIFNHLTSNNNSQGHNLTPYQIKREMDGMFAAGSDTTAHSMSFILLLLAIFPKYQEEARTEVLNLLETLKNSGESIKRHHLHSLPILDRIIQESLRLFPPTPLIARELSGPVTLKNGTELPKYTTIGIGIHTIQRKRDIWGSDADKFRPERFLPENLKEIKNFSYSFLPFAAGERNCVGLKFARYSMKMMLMKILKNFQVETDEKFEEIECEVNVLAKKVNGWNLKFKKI